jgi:hypothetical protein
MKYSRHWQDLRMASLIKSGGGQHLPPLYSAARKYIRRNVSFYRLVFVIPPMLLAALVARSGGSSLRDIYILYLLASVVVYFSYEFVIRLRWEMFQDEPARGE